MRKKNTEELTNDIIKTSNIKEYITDNNQDFIDQKFHTLLREIIIEKNLNNKDVIEKSNLNRVYFYHLLSGKRKPSRNKILQLAFGLDLDIKETQHLLKISGINMLYSKRKRDAVIIYALNNHISLMEAELLLEEEGEALICSSTREVK